MIDLSLMTDRRRNRWGEPATPAPFPAEQRAPPRPRIDGPEANTLMQRTPDMDHIVSVSLDADTLKQLDDLRRASATVPNRVEVIKRLIWDAHAKIAPKSQAA